MRACYRSASIAAFAMLGACGGSDSTAPATNLAGSYTLQSANGQSLPATGTVPIYGTVQILSGTGTISNTGAVSVSLVASVGGAGTLTLTESGTVVRAPNGYTFSFSDGTSANATCSSSSCTIVYDANTLLFVKG